MSPQSEPVPQHLDGRRVPADVVEMIVTTAREACRTQILRIEEVHVVGMYQQHADKRLVESSLMRAKLDELVAKAALMALCIQHDVSFYSIVGRL